MFGVAPNPDPDGGNWTVLIASPEPDEDDEDDDPGLTVVALTEDVDLPGVTEKEVRFDLYEDSEENPHAVYVGVSLHRHGDDSDEFGGCEVFPAAEGRSSVDDVPDDLRQAVEGVMEFQIHEHGEEPLDASPVRVSDVTGPDTEPRGFQ